MQTETTSTAPTVSQIVQTDYRMADVFQKWGINFCCAGNQPLADACSSQNINPAEVQADMQRAAKTVRLSNALPFAQWPLPFLVDYLVYVHHGYVRQTLPALQETLSTYVAGHLKKYPYLFDVERAFRDLATELLEKMRFEEESIFPYARQVSHTFERQEVYGPLFVRTLRKPLDEVVRTGHNRLVALQVSLRTLTNHYVFAADVCTNHRVIYHKLKEFDDDLTQHNHLENEILFPKVLEMEKSLLQL